MNSYICVQCDKPFERKFSKRNPNPRFCSRRCQGDFYRGPRLPIPTCIDCGIQVSRRESIRCRPCADLHRRNAIERFWQYTIQTDDCWLWQGPIMNRGYGCFYVDGKSTLAHRFSYRSFNGSIPTDMTVDHICHVRICVNPNHLQLLTLSENSIDGARRVPLKTHCPKGHSYNETNTRHYKGARFCRVCDRERGYRKPERAKIKLTKKSN